MSDSLLGFLTAAGSPAEKAAAVAETVFDTLPLFAARVARGCIVLNWFNRDVVASLLPKSNSVQVDEVYQHLEALPFIESIPKGLAFHDLTRSGLLEKYSENQPTLLMEVARKAAPAYAAHPGDDVTTGEALYCHIVAGQQHQAIQLLDTLIMNAGARRDWQYLAGILHVQEQAENLSFVSPLPRTALHWLIRGISHASQRDLAGAIVDFDNAIDLEPTNAAAYHLRGMMRHELGDRDNALVDFNHAIDLNPADAAVYYNRGTTYQQLGDLRRAITDFDRVVELRPEHAPAFNNRGIARAELGDLHGAIADFNCAIQIDPQYAIALNNRANAHASHGDLNIAIHDYTHAIELNPVYAIAYNNRGMARYELGDLAGAIADYSEAIRINPQFAAAYNNRGIAHYELDNREAALADYDRAIELNPQLTGLDNERVLVRKAQGDLAAAEVDFRTAILRTESRLDADDVSSNIDLMVRVARLDQEFGNIQSTDSDIEDALRILD